MNFGWKSVNGVLVRKKYLQILLTQYVPRCSCKTGCAKICGYKPEHCTEYCKCQGCDNKQKHLEAYSTKCKF